MSGQGVTRLRTIGEALRSAREAQGKSLDDAAVATRIRSSYLEALEEERFGDLGGNVYAKGFLRSYAGYLGVDPAPLLEAYRAQETPEAPLFEHAPRAIGGLESVLGSPAGVRLTVNGRDLGVADRSGDIWRHRFTPKSRSLDSERERQ